MVPSDGSMSGFKACTF